MTAIGSHCVVELYGCPSDLLNDPRRIREAIRRAALKAGATLLGEVEYQFTPQGVTAVAILAESHISIHTWPEIAFAAADVFTCGAHTDPEAACRYLAKELCARQLSFRQLDRGDFGIANADAAIEEEEPWESAAAGSSRL